MPRFSIILTASNRGLLLRRALTSIFSQSFQDWELVLVADSPTDPIVLDILNQLKDTERVIVIFVPFEVAPDDRSVGGAFLDTSQVKRVALAVNQGLAVARGEWITYLCDDDIYLPKRFEPYLPEMENFDAVVGNARFVKMNGTIHHQNKFKYGYPEPTLPGHAELLKDIAPANFICHDSICHRRTDLRWPLDLQATPNDWRFWLELHRSGFKFKRIDAVMERATMPGAWRDGATQNWVLGLTGEILPGGTMRKVTYAKNTTNKKQVISSTLNQPITVYPGERIDADLASYYKDTNGVKSRVLFPGFSLCGDFSFPTVEGEKEKPKAHITQQRNRIPVKLAHALQEASKEVSVKEMTLQVPPERQALQDDVLEPPREFEPIAKIQGGTVLTASNHEPKHPFDLD